MDSRSNQIWCGCDTARVHHPGVQVHAYGCASFASSLLAKEFVTDVLSRVVVRVVRIAAFQTLKRILRPAVCLVREPTRRTPTRGIRRVDLLNRDTAFFGLVLDVLVESSERPCVEALCTRHAVTDIYQVLEGDTRTTAFVRFFNQFVRHAVQQLFKAACLFLTDRLNILVSVARPTLLERRTALLTFTVPVVKFGHRPKHARRSDGDVFNSEIYAKNRSVLAWIGSVHVSLCSNVKVELICGFAVVKRRAGRLVLVGKEVFGVGRLTAFVGQHVLGGDTPINSRKRSIVIVKRYTPFVVFEKRRRKIRETRVLPAFSLRYDGLQRVCRATLRRLDGVRVKVRFVANVVVSAVVEFAFARFNVAVVVSSVQDNVVCGPVELSNRLVKKVSVAFGHSKFDLNSSTNFDKSSIALMLIKLNIWSGVAPAVNGGSIVNRTRFLPRLKSWISAL